MKLAGYAGDLTALATDPQIAGTIYAGSEAAGNGVQVASVHQRGSQERGRRQNLDRSEHTLAGCRCFECGGGPDQFQRRVRADHVSGLLMVRL